MPLCALSIIILKVGEKNGIENCIKNRNMVTITSATIYYWRCRQGTALSKNKLSAICTIAADEHFPFHYFHLFFLQGTPIWRSYLPSCFLYFVEEKMKRKKFSPNLHSSTEKCVTQVILALLLLSLLLLLLLLDEEKILERVSVFHLVAFWNK